MGANYKIAAEPRTDKGKGASRRLRHAGKVPAIMYGADKEPAMLMVSHDELFHAAEDEAFFSSIITLACDGKEEKVIVKDMQRHPAKVQMLHVDFLRIDDTHVLHVHVPLHFVNESIAPGVKAGGNVSHLMSEVEITCLPKDLPEFIEVDLSTLEGGSSLHLSDISLPEGVSLVELSHGEGHDQPVANIHMPRGAREDEEAEALSE